jgi:hypothetical protein
MDRFWRRPAPSVSGKARTVTGDAAMPPDDLPPLPSERRFGLLFTALFLVLGGYGLLHGRWVAVSALCLALAAPLAFVSLAAPRLLAPLNRAWFRLGLLLGRIVNPLVLGILFFLLLTPIAITQRLLGRDALRLRRRDTASHWVERQPAGPAPESFKHQF